MTTFQDILKSAEAEDYSFDKTLALLNELDDDSVDTPDTKEGNTFIHKLISVFIEKLKTLYAPWRHYTKVSSDRLPKDKESVCTKSFKALLEKLVELNQLSNEPNHQGHRPLDLLRSPQSLIAHTDIKEVEQALLPIFDSALFIYPGRKYVTDLSLRRSSKKPEKVCEIPDAPMQSTAMDLTLHQRLAFYERYLMNSGALKKVINLAVAHIGFVISDKAKTDAIHKPVFVTFPIRISNYMVFAEKSKHGTHSEDGVIDCLHEETFIVQLLNDLKKHHTYLSKQKIYALVLDLHSTAEVCLHCQSKLHQLQTDQSPEGFLQTFQRVAASSEYGFDYVFPQKTQLKLITRVSGGINIIINDGELAGPIPKAVVWKESHHDIKQHPAGVMLQLPPSNWRHYNTVLVKKDAHDADVLENYKKNLRRTYHEAFDYQDSSGETEEQKKRREEMRPTATRAYDKMVQEWRKDHPNITLTFSCPTAFSNTGGNAESVKGLPDSNVTFKNEHALRGLRKALII